MIPSAETDYITISNPIASFGVDSSFANCPPLPVQFINNSSNATTFEWDFGDNSGRSDAINPGHLYTLPGEYDVSLIATSTPNCKRHPG